MKLFILAGSFLFPALTNASDACPQAQMDPELMKVRSQFYTISSRLPELKLGLQRYSSQHAEPVGTVLLVHGSSFGAKLSFAFAMDGRSWVDHLTCAGFTVYTLDFLGYGDSDRYPEMVQHHKAAPPLGRGAEVAEDLNLAVDFILSQEQQSRIDLIAHSWGAAVAARFAGEHPAKVHLLVLYAAITAVASKESKPVSQVPAYTAMTPQQRVAALNALAPAEQRPLLAAELFQQWGQAWLASDRYQQDSMVLFPAGPQADVDDFYRGQSFYDPAKITAKVLLIRGEYDNYPTAEHSKQLLQALVKAKLKRSVEIKLGTHVLHLEQNRQQLYQAVKDFLLNTAR
jgi:pimeloyl-ACP methyl ester carboxylesterase